MAEVGGTANLLLRPVSGAHQVVHAVVRDRVAKRGKRSGSENLINGVVHGRECDATERGAEADAAGTCVFEGLHGGRPGPDGGEHIYGLGNRVAEGANGFKIGEARGEKDIRAGFSEGLEATDDVVERGAAMKEVFTACGQGEREEGERV